MHYQKLISYIFVLVPLIYIIFSIIFNNDIINPFSYLISSTGFIALTFLLVILFIPIFSYINNFFDRKILGLSAFTYTFIHLCLYILDNSTSLNYLVNDISNILYIQVGYIAFLLFLPLVFSSTIKAKIMLKDNWYKIHRLIYIITLLSFLHYYLIIKADFLLFGIYVTATILILMIKYRVLRNE